MQDVIPKIRELDGYLFIDRFDLGEAGLRAKIAERFTSLVEAQLWINIVLLDGFISEVVGDDWDLNDPLVDKILSAFRVAWFYQIKACFPESKFAIDKVMDSESGDVGLRLTSIG